MARYSLFVSDELVYPDSDSLYRPSDAYPEYPFLSRTCARERNSIYAGVREALHLAGLDSSNYGSGKWNPLGEYIRPGMRVLIKPNLVMHDNPSGSGTDCLYTHPSVIAAVIDYVVIALGGEGSIIVADAPMQSCNFEELVKQSGLGELIDWYREQGVDIALRDMRGLKSVATRAGLRQSVINGALGKVIDLGHASSFEGLPAERIESLRITNYDPAELKKHHTPDKHEYYISTSLLEADVVVNLPKAKTHRKAGITGALKNMVGVNVRKEYLPHHANGSKAEGFDEYCVASAFKRMSDRLLDIRNAKIGKGGPYAHILSNLLISGLRFFGKLASGDSYSEGSWFGNDTIWRTVLDLNKIVFHADKEGVLREEPQRRMVSLCDMVTIGQGDGPLLPVPGFWHMLAFCDDPVVHDVAMARLMGTDESLIPTVHEALHYEGIYAISYANESLPNCSSNAEMFDGVGVGRLNEELLYQAKPAFGWVDHFERKVRNARIEEPSGEN